TSRIRPADVKWCSVLYTVASETRIEAASASPWSCSAVTCRSPLSNKRRAKATRWRVGRRPARRRRSTMVGIGRFSSMSSDIGRRGVEIKPRPSLGGSWSIAGPQAVDQLPHSRDIAVRIKRVRSKAEGIVAGEHQLEFDIVGMPDRLQGLLNAEASRVGLLAGRGRLVLRPVGEQAGAETTHAVDLVGADFERLRRGDEDQR